MTKTNTYARVLALLLAMPAAAFAADATGTAGASGAGGPPDFKPTPGMITLMTLGSGGLLMPLFSDDMMASQQARIGDSRNTDGSASSLPGAHFRDLNVTGVGGFSLMKEIPVSSGAAFLRLSGAGAWTQGSAGTPINSSVENQRIAAEAFYAPSPSQIFGAGIAYDHMSGNSTLTTDPYGSYITQSRQSAVYQIFYGQQFSPFWGIAAKSELWQGPATIKNYVFTPASSLLISQTGADDRSYNEVNLVGTFSHQNSPWMPEGWVAHPSFGATFERSFEQTVTNSLGATVSGPVGATENYGLLTANLRIERAQTPGPDLQVLPSLTLGFEHEYANTLAAYVKEPDYAVAGAGIGFAFRGQRIDLDYKIRQGLSGARQYQVFGVTTSLSF